MLTLALGLALAARPGSAWGQESERSGLHEPPIGQLARSFLDEGHRLEAAGDLPGARMRFEKALELEPAWQATTVDLGRVLVALGEDAAARDVYERAPYYDDAVLALAALHERQGRLEEALALYRRLRNLRPESAEPLLLEAGAMATTAPEGARDLLLEYLQRPEADADDPRVLEAVNRVALALWNQGDTAASQALIQAVRDARPFDASEGPDPGDAALDALADRLWVEEAARQMARANRQPLSPAEEGELRQARERFNEGDLEGALARAQALERLVDTSPEVNAFLADLAEARGEIGMAETHLWHAEWLDPLDATHPARMGDLLRTHYSGRMAADASAAYGRAIARGGRTPILWLHRAQTAAMAGQSDAAMVALEAFLERSSDGSRMEAARKLMADLQRQRPSPPVAPAQDKAPPEGVRPETWMDFYRSLVQVRRGEPGDLEAAEERLARIRAQAPQVAPAWNLTAEIAVQQGRIDVAIGAYETSLEQDPDQIAVRVLLADLHGVQGDVATQDRLIAEAAALGSADAHLRLAVKRADAWNIWSARRHLDAYFSATTSGASYEQALGLRDDVDRRIRGGLVLCGLLVLVGFGAPVAVRRRARSGQPLTDLLAAAPDVWPEVARILSALRHEVLKHNTTVLPGVRTALAAGDPEPSRWAAERLFGERGAVVRFWEHVRELEAIGMRHGVRLNLQHVDPTFAPMLAAVVALEGLEDGMRSGDPGIGTALADIDTALNRTAYQGLSALLRRLCLLHLTPELLQKIAERTRSELGDNLAPGVQIDGPDAPTALRMYRGELEDILTNLLRNALEAVHGQAGARVGLKVGYEADPITGLEDVVIRVQDDAPRRLSTAVIRGRYIGRGLGLAVDLISRNGGSVRVEDEPGWSKAVVVRLPRAETTEAEEGT